LIADYAADRSTAYRAYTAAAGQHRARHRADPAPTAVR